MSSKPYLVGIVGGSASGKTSFLRDLLARLPKEKCAVVSQDNYYRTIDEQVLDANGKHNFDLPTAIHRDRLHDDLHKLLRGECVTRTEYTFNHREKSGRLITIEPAEVILLEGLFLFHYEEIRALLDLRVFIDANEDVCKLRRLQRDFLERGYPADHVEYQWDNHVLPAYRNFILPHRDEAQLIVTNHGGYEAGLEVVTHQVLIRIDAMQREVRDPQ
ncbi:MAG: uridine-cytidine kinase [Gemmataceae bacterium]|nr:uridine-cytidine kinase [Gemmataceae bacterium]